MTQELNRLHAILLEFDFMTQELSQLDAILLEFGDLLGAFEWWMIDGLNGAVLWCRRWNGEGDRDVEFDFMTQEINQLYAIYSIPTS